MEFPKSESDENKARELSTDKNFRELVAILHKSTTELFLECKTELFDLVAAGILLDQTIPILFDIAMTDKLRKLTIEYASMEEALAALKAGETSGETNDETAGGTHDI